MSRANGNGLAHRYHLLEPHERFRAALEAGARDDAEERRRLVDTCPMRSARITDPAYVDRVDTSRELAVAVALEVGPQLAAARALQAAAELATRALAAPAAAGAQDGLVGEEADEPLTRAMVEVATTVRRDAAACYAAFTRICRVELGLEPEVVLAAHLGPMLELLGLDELDGAKPDKAALAQWREQFGRTWRERVGK